MSDCNAKASIKVDGKMNERGAGIVGKRYALAALIIATGIALSAFIHVIRWW